MIVGLLQLGLISCCIWHMLSQLLGDTAPEADSRLFRFGTMQSLNLLHACALVLK